MPERCGSSSRKRVARWATEETLARPQCTLVARGLPALSPAVGRSGVTQQRSLPPCLFQIALLVALVLVPRFADANGADLPPQILLQGFLKPEDGRLQLVIRIPLILLADLALPKRGPGYLDLARIDEGLREAAAAAGREIVLFEDGTRLVPTRGETRITLPSDQSFQSYATARAHLQGPPLPVDTNVFWNQGFFDAVLEYPIRSPRADFSIRMNVAPGLGHRVTLRLEFLPVSGPALTYKLAGGSGWVPLDPRWYAAAWFFVTSGVVDAFAIDRLVFLFCLVAPFRQFWSLLAVVMALTILQAMTLIAGAWGAVPDARWLAALFDTCLAAAIVLLAIENVVAPSLRRRWFVGTLIGALGGFGFGRLLTDRSQFAGVHSLVALVSFNLGVALGEVVALGLVLVVLGVLFARVLGRRLGVVVLSAVLGHVGWHWMLEASHRLEHTASAGLSPASLAAGARWVLLGLVAGGAAWFLPKEFGGTPTSPLLPEVLGRGTGE